jgi:glutathione S-transferase
MSSDSYKLSYFDLRGLGETSRFLFKLAAVEFEDHRVPFPPTDETKQWAKEKDSHVFATLPELTVNKSTVIPQSKAIERYLAKRFGFMGSNPLEEALIDSFGEQIRDLKDSFDKVKGDAEKESKWIATDFPNHLRLIERAAGNKGFLVGDKLSLADVQMFSLIDRIFNDNSDYQPKLGPILAQHAKIHKLKDIGENAAIKKWREERPKTKY